MGMQKTCRYNHIIVLGMAVLVLLLLQIHGMNLASRQVQNSEAFSKCALEQIHMANDQNSVKLDLWDQLTVNLLTGGPTAKNLECPPNDKVTIQTLEGATAVEKGVVGLSSQANSLKGGVRGSGGSMDATAVTQANIEAARKFHLSQNKTFLHFFVHIPKSGFSYAFQTVARLVLEHPLWKQLPEGDRFRPCDEGLRDPYPFHTHYRGQIEGNACTAWMSEKPWAARAMHLYIVIRNPRHHVLSQYFHCTESADHRKFDYRMPRSIDEWLQAWENALLNTTQRQRNQHFSCYTPINAQTSYVWPQLKPDMLINMTAHQRGATATASRTLVEALGIAPTERSLDINSHSSEDYNATIIEDLLQRFDVVGDTSRMVLSICTIFTKYTGWVSPQCNCSNSTSGGAEGSHRQQLGAAIEYDAKKHAHGVQHHGATYSTTFEQEVLITRLTKYDQILYEIAQQVLDYQVAEVEATHQVRLCRKHFREQ